MNLFRFVRVFMKLKVAHHSYKARWLLEMNLVVLNNGQVMRTIPEVALHSPTIQLTDVRNLSASIELTCIIPSKRWICDVEQWSPNIRALLKPQFIFLVFVPTDQM
ncbi:hypothetical protein TNCV_430131 [Trichonephila clavipes]|nr:hypothetical protein TNCV_430131 [Trichonephila clavipes]